MKKGRTGFLKIDFRDGCKCAHYGDLYISASRLLDECHAEISKNTIARFEKLANALPSNCYEHRLLMDKFLVRRNAPGDCARAVKDLNCLSKELKRCEHGCSSHLARIATYIHMFHIDVLRELANSLYYMERDLESLHAYRKLLLFAKEHSMQYRGISDIRHKVLSLEFMLSPSGCRRAMLYVWKGHFGKALAVVDKAIADFGMDYLDHEALTIAAICNAEIGNVRRARSLINRDHYYSPNCLATSFYWALMNLSCDKSGMPIYVIRKIIRNEIRSSCEVGSVRQMRMRVIAKVVYSARIRGGHFLIDEGAGKLISIGVIDFIRICIWFIEVEPGEYERGHHCFARMMQWIREGVASRTKPGSLK